MRDAIFKLKIEVLHDNPQVYWKESSDGKLFLVDI